ncbi:MAG: 2,3-bisphosphoglycerate-independent phosphoglycerate mutase [Candidatus Diapherotrites archaeon]|nr:2,3-bisphosphoglycerate-independent phosphoglycerate mutase [Candidatus Diapherotrites archaeon]
MKCLFIVASGAGDRPIKRLGNKTPYQLAHTPNLDHLSEIGEDGLMDPIAPGIWPGSDTSHLQLFGYDPHEYYFGRGPIEALGAGMELQEGDIAFRCNFATVKDGVIVDRRAGRIKEGTAELARALNEIAITTVPGVQLIFKESTEHRAVLVLRGTSLSPQIIDNDPHDDGLPPTKITALEHTDAAIRTAKALSEFIDKAHKILRSHPLNRERELPANYILCRGAGVLKRPPTFEEKYGFKGAVVAASGMIIGVGRLLGMDVIIPPGATGGYDTDLTAKADAALEALKTHDYVFLHIKCTDLAGHDGDPEKKIELIEKVDEMVGYITRNIDLENTIIAFTSDHSTPCSVRNHSADPVPLVIAGGDVRFDYVKHFDELSATQGALFKISGKDLFPILLDFMGRAKKYGA